MLPPEPAAYREEEASGQLAEELEPELLLSHEKLLALEEEDWACCNQGALGAGGSKGGEGKPAGARRRRQPPPESHDATLLASLLEEMHVPPAQQEQAAAAVAIDSWGVCGVAAPTQLIRTSLVGAAVAVVAALASMAVRTTLAT